MNARGQEGGHTHCQLPDHEARAAFSPLHPHRETLTPDTWGAGRMWVAAATGMGEIVVWEAGTWTVLHRFTVRCSPLMVSSPRE